MIDEKTENWYAPGKVKISWLSQEEIEAYRKKKLERQAKEREKKLAGQDLMSYMIEKVYETQKRIK